MKIRKATLTDAPAIANIHTSSWRNTYQNALTEQYLSDVAPIERNKIWQHRLEDPKPNQHVFIAEVDNDITGFVCIYLGENPRWGAYLDNLHVNKTHQSQGVGKSLLIEAARCSFQKHPAQGMCLLVNQDNIHAQAFYIKMGAVNAEEWVWNAPDGSAVPTYWFVWGNLNNLANRG